jgi:hypothetical protein
VNKKGQFEDEVDVVIGIVAIIIGISIIYFMQSAQTFTIDNAQKQISSDVTELTSYDNKFVATDLLNLMKYPLTENYTFGEIVSLLPDNYDNVQPEFSSVFEMYNFPYHTLGCKKEVYDEILAYYSLVYASSSIRIAAYSIRIAAYDQNGARMLMLCPAEEWKIADSAFSSFGYLTLPSTDPGNDIMVTLGVYE